MNELSNEDSYHLLNSYKNSEPKIWTKHQIDSYNEFITHDMGGIIKQRNPVVLKIENTKGSKDIRYYKNIITFGDNYLKRPHHVYSDGGQTIIYPQKARDKKLTYETVISVNIEHKIIGIHVDGSETELKNIMHKDIVIGKLPVMLYSIICNLTNLSNDALIKLGEDIADPGGYCIINGAEKVVIGKERKNMNHVYFFDNSKKLSDSNLYTCEIKSQIEDRFESAHRAVVTMNKKESIELRLNPGFASKGIPITIVFKALGIVSDRDIIEYIVHDINNDEMIEPLKTSLMLDIIDKTTTTTVSIQSEEDALLYIADRIITPTMEQETLNTPEKKIRHIRNIFEKDLLPHVGTSYKKKALFLGYMVRKLLLGKNGMIKSDDRDNLSNKRMETTGVLMSYLFKHHYGILIENMKDDISKVYKAKDVILSDFDTMVPRAIKTAIIENGFRSAFMSGNWSTNKNAQEAQQGTSQVLQRKSHLDTISNLRRLVTPTTGGAAATQLKKHEIRRLHCSQWGMCDAVETPEGPAIGLVKNAAITVLITIKTSSFNIREILSEENILLVDDILPNEIYENNYAKILVDGDWFACTTEISQIYKRLINAKRNGLLNPTISIIRDFLMNEIRIYTDSGRCVRPLLIVDSGNKLRLNKKIIQGIQNETITWDELFVGRKDLDFMKSAVLEYLDVQECEHNTLIAMNATDLNNADLNTHKYTHCEIHPLVILGIVSGCIPFANNNQAPRNLFTSAQSKQGIGLFALNYYNRFDTKSLVLYYPESRIVTTIVNQLAETQNQPSGMNAIVAVGTYTGFNQEDAYILNQAAIDRGMFKAAFFKTYEEENKNEQKFTKPDPKTTTGIKRYAGYDKIDNNGFIKPGTKVYKNDIIIGKVNKIDRLSHDKQIEWKDASIHLKETEGVIDKVIVDNNNEGYQFCKVRIRIDRTPQIGDKFASTMAQKGTVGMIYRQEDMPFTEDGLVPDIIINCHAFPSRMTIGQFLEGILAKSCAYHGRIADATPFNKIDKDGYVDELKKIGYQHHGNEKMYNGFTSEPMNTELFMTPNYYYRLLHIVADKIHSRGHTGPDQSLVRQPLEGRSRDGALRFGEMERDASLAHGTMAFTKERFHESSDAHYQHVCSNCGFKAIANENIDRYECRLCDQNEEKYTINRVDIPYAMHILVDELEPTGIYMKIGTEDHDI
jgi:DNA-directed RNA polymerase II subunit RPB2